MIDTQKLRQRILDLAIRGKLVPQDPNDEPASVLLEKIRAEKERLIKEGKIKRPKAKKPSDTSHYEDLPEGWEEVNLGELFSIGSAKRIMKSDWQRKGIPFYRTREVVKLNEFGKVDNELFISEEYYQEIKDKYGVPLANDIMLTAVGTIGVPYVVKDYDTFYYKDASVLCLDNIYNLNPRYFYYLFQSTDMRKQMFGESKGTTVDTITITKAEYFTLLLPPNDEQERIVAKIEEWLRIIQNIKEGKESLVSFVDLMKSKILNLAMQGKLVEQDPSDEPAADMLRRINPKAKIITDNPHSKKMPQGWCTTTLKGICSKVVDGDHNPPAGEILPTHYLMISASNIINDKIALEPVRYLSKENFLICDERTRLSKGDILLTTVGTIGRTAIYEDNNITLQRSVSALTPMINSQFLKFYLDSPSVQKYMIENAKGTAQKGFYLNQLCSLEVTVPPYNEQLRIVAKIEELLSILSNVEAPLQS